MTIKDELNEDLGIIKSDPLMVIWWALGIFCILVGCILFSTTPPNLQIGFPSFAIGFAFFTFGSNHYSNTQSRRILHEINEKLKKLDIENKEKNNNIISETESTSINRAKENEEKEKPPLEKAILFLAIIATIAAVFSMGIQILALQTISQQILGFILELIFLIIIVLAAKISFGIWLWQIKIKN